MKYFLFVCKKLVKGAKMSVLALLLLTISVTTQAHNRVVVIPLGGDDAEQPSFRIVSQTDSNSEVPQAHYGRLEYTADSKPRPDSLWGTVCDDGQNNINHTNEQGNAIANAACRDMGYLGGSYLSSLDTLNGTLEQTIDNAVCPANATTFSQCSFLSVNNCGSGEDIGVRCHLASEEIIINNPIDPVSCSLASDQTTLSYNFNFIDNPTSVTTDPVQSASNADFSLLLKLDFIGGIVYNFIAQSADQSETFAFVNFNCADGFPASSNQFSFTDLQGLNWLGTVDITTNGATGDIEFNSITFERQP